MKPVNNTYRNFLLLLIWVSIASSGLHGQSIDNLESRHGFQDIKLDSEITSYPTLQFQKRNKNPKTEEPILIYTPENGIYQKIGDVLIKDLKVKTFLGKIIEIKIITEKNSDIMKALKLLYGEPKFSVRSNAWEWRSEGVLLSLRSTGKNKIEIIYTSRKLNLYIQELKEEGIEDISTDF